MVQDYQCNRVYFSALLRDCCPKTFRGLTSALDRHDVPWSLLSGTKDIWCRDYMPLQIYPGKLAGYRYYPDYLLRNEKDMATITDTELVCRMNGLRFDSSLASVVLDGGNVVKADGRAIMTSKFFEENPGVDLSWFIDHFERTVGAHMVVLPLDSNEEFGHSDGICRYIGNDRVLMTNYADFDPMIAARFRRALEAHFEKVEELEFNSGKVHKYSWAYINWLQTEQVLIIPSFGIPEDSQALDQISRLMPEYAGRIEQVDASDLVIHGGCFNCCSWTIRDEQTYNLP